MVYNDVLKRDIPVGWKNDKITNIFKIIMGSSPKGDSINECQNGTLFFQGKVDFDYRYPIERTYTTMPIKLAMKNDILLSVRAPVGDVNIALTDCCIGRGVAAIRGIYSSYTYYTIKNLKPIFDKYNNFGTTFGSINKDDLKNIMVVQVPDDIQKEFYNTVNSIDLLIEKLSIENIKLICLRDWLLPMLMNGQVEVIE